jgi:thioredoxin 1
MKEITSKDFDDVINGEKVLVDFWAAWCGPCKMQAPILESLEQELSGVTIAKLNVDEEGEIAARFGVMSIPTLIIFENGKETQRLVGLQSKEKLAQALS